MRAYRTPLVLFGVFLVILGLFALTPDRSPVSASADPTAEPTHGPRECVVCPIDQRCDPQSGRCMFVEHTPWPCVPSARFDDRAGQCLPEGAPPPPPRAVAPSTSEPDGRTEFPGGIGGRTDRQPRQPNLPGFGNR